MLNSSHFLSGLYLGVRARYLQLAAFSLVFLVVSSLLSAMFSGRQSVALALDVGISVIRLVIPLIIALLAQELISREFERRYFLNSLTYPRPRQSFLVGRFFSILALSVFLLLAMALLLGLVVCWVANIYSSVSAVDLGFSYFVVVGFIALDLLQLTAVACLLSVLASTPSFVLIGTFGFMLVARSYSAMHDLVTRDAGLVGYAEGYRTSLGVLGYFFPDLGALDLRMMAIYGRPEFLPVDWPWLLLSSVGYSLTLIALAVLALQRKNFA